MISQPHDHTKLYYLLILATCLVLLLLPSMGYSAVEDMAGKLEMYQSQYHLDAVNMEKLSEEWNAMRYHMQHLWLVVSVMIVFLMKGGFLLFEAGLVRSKSTINTAQKNLTDTFIATLIFYVAGYNIMFGPTIGGWFGWTSDIGFHELDHTFFLYQVVFCSMAATVVSGATAERMKFTTYMAGTVFISLIIYPFFGHWAWGNKIISENTGFLMNMGFIDFAGATVVCALGGWVALAAMVILGPRLGKFNADGTTNPMPANNIVLAGFGVLVLWVGALAFNAGLANIFSEDIAHIMSNTLIAGSAGGFSSLVLGRIRDGLYRPERCIYGIMGGIVAVAAGCHLFSWTDSMIIGLTSGVITTLSFVVLTNRFKIDDVVCAVPINAFAGMWGTLLVGALGDTSRFVNESRLEQFLVQGQGVLLSIAWGFGMGYLFFKIMDMLFGIRVSEEEEIKGLNEAEHGVTMGTGMLQQRLIDIVDGKGDLTQRLDETTGDESAEIAVLFNRFVERVQALMINIDQNAKVITSSSDRLNTITGKFSEGFAKISQQSTVVSSSTEEVSNELGVISKVVDNVNHSISSISKGANEMSENVSSVNSDMQEMRQSIADISGNTSQASGVAKDAHEMIQRATKAMNTLSKTSESIDSILAMIHDIADQTNLLALNATIEAAQAGEAGKGFAVVAQEVKNLANQTAEATGGISFKIKEIQEQTKETDAVVHDLETIIATINESLASISSQASNQNDSATRISTNMDKTATNAHDIAQNISDMASGTSEASKSANSAAHTSQSVLGAITNFTEEANANSQNAEKVTIAVDDLSTVASKLSGMVSEYKIK